MALAQQQFSLIQVKTKFTIYFYNICTTECCKIHAKQNVNMLIEGKILCTNRIIIFEMACYNVYKKGL